MSNIKKLNTIPNIIAMLVPIATVILLVNLRKPLIKEWDRTIPFYVYLVSSIIFLVLSIYTFNDLSLYLQKKLKQISGVKLQFLAILVFASIATIYTYQNVEARHRVQSDESTYLAMAQNMFHNQLAGACDEGIYNEQNTLTCTKTSNNFKAKIQSWFYVVGMPFLGLDLQWVFSARILLYFMTFLAVWLAILLWTKSSLVALLTTSFLLMQPTVMFQFRSTSVEPLYIFLAALSLIYFKWTWRKNDIWSWSLFSIVLSAFLQTRQETVFAVFAFGIFSLPYLLENSYEKGLKKFNFLAFSTILTFASLPILLTIAGYKGYSFQGGQFEAHGHFFNHIMINWKQMTLDTNSKGFLINPFLKYFTYTSLLGLIAALLTSILIRTKKLNEGYIKESVIRLRYILVFFFLYHIQSYMIFENVSGDFTISINQRYSLVILPFMAFFTAILFEIATRIILNIWTNNNLKTISLAINVVTILGLILAFVLTAKHQDSLKQNIMHSRNHLTTEEFQINKWLADYKPGKKLFIYARPWHFIGYGSSSIHYRQYSRLTEKSRKELARQFNNEVYYVRGLDCWDSKTYHKKAIEKRISNVCDNFEEKFDLKLVHKEMITNNYLLDIRKIKGLKNYGPKQLKIGIFHYIQPKDMDSAIVQYSYGMDKVTPKLHSLKILLNDKLVKEVPFETASILDTIKNPNIEPGYNTLSFEIYDAKGNLLVSKNTTNFYHMKKAAELSRFPNELARQSWGAPRRNRSVSNLTLTSAGQEYQFGIGTHAYSQMIYNLKGKFNRFKAMIAKDDAEMGGDGVLFIVKGDDVVLYRSRNIQNYDIESIDIDITGVNKFELLVDSLDNKSFDHANWINPVIISNEDILKEKDMQKQFQGGK